MSQKTWKKTWGKILPFIQERTENITQNKILDKKICHAISKLLENNADINDTSPIIQCTILHLCVGKGLLNAAHLLIQKGADVKKTNRFHETPFQYIQYAPFNKEELKQLFCPPKTIIQKKSR